MRGLQFLFIALLLILTSTINSCRKSIKIESSFDPQMLQLVLEMNDSYDNEDNVSPKVTITNRSDTSLALAKPLDPFTLHFIVQDTLGNDVPKYLFVDYAFQTLEVNIIPPGESISETVSDLKEIYRFKPGIYRFQAIYGVPPNPRNRYNFTINQPKHTHKLFVGFVYSNKETVHIGKLKFKFPPMK